MKVLFLRLKVADDLHSAVVKAAEADKRSINSMGNILLGEALSHRSTETIRLPNEATKAHANASFRPDTYLTPPESAA